LEIDLIFGLLREEERALGRIKERARILRRLLRLRPWPLALAMLALAMAAALGVGLSGLVRAAVSPAFVPLCLERSRVCRAEPRANGRVRLLIGSGAACSL
jgi:hypothetical protein